MSGAIVAARSCMHRREFMKRAPAAAAALYAAGLSARSIAGPTLDIMLDCPAGESAEYANGAAMAVAEAQRAATLFGGSIVLRTSGDTAPPASSIGVIISAWPDRLPPVDDHRLVMNVAARDAAVRRGCDRNLVHVAASAAAIDSVRKELGARDTDAVVEWHSSLARFGADSLNKRHLERFGRRMDSTAWCAWFAVMAAWDAALRGKAATARDLAGRLRDPATRLDGHKGVALRFAGPELVQPLYLVRGGAVIADAPSPAGSTIC